MLITILVILVIVSALAFFGKLTSTLQTLAAGAGYIIGAISKHGKTVAFGALLAGCLIFIALAMFAIGVLKGNILISGIGCLIAISLFILFWTPIGITLGLLWPPSFGKRVYPMFIRLATFWLCICGLGSMLLPKLLPAAAKEPTFLVFMAIAGICGLIFTSIMEVNTKTGVKIAAGAISLMALLVVFKTTAPDAWSAIADRLWVSKDKFVSGSRQIKADRISGFGYLTSDVLTVYKMDSTGKIKPVNLTTSLKEGQAVQYFHRTEEVVVIDETALIEIAAPDSLTGNFLGSEKCWIEQSKVRRGEMGLKPDKYIAKSGKSGGLLGRKTLEVSFQTDEPVTLYDLPAGKKWKMDGAGYGVISTQNPRTGEMTSIANDLWFKDCPPMLKLSAPAGTKIVLSFK